MAHSFRGQSTRAGKTWRQEHEVDAHSDYIVSKQRDEYGMQLAFSFAFKGPRSWNVLPKFRVGLPSSVKSSRKPSQTPAEVCLLSDFKYS